MKCSHAITDYSPFNIFDDENSKDIIENGFRYETIPPYTLIVAKRQKINRVGYICKGSIDFSSSTQDGGMARKGSLGKGDYFGIESMFNGGLALFDELTTEYVDCFVIEKEKFFKLVARNSRVKKFFEDILYEKLKRYMGYPFWEIQPDRDLITNRETLRIRKAINYIEAKYMTNITLDDISSMTGLSRFHFSRVFKLATGHTFKEYLNLKRLEVAKKLLQFPEINISQACYSVGFNDVSYFSRIFKKHEGINPTLYRKKKFENSG